MIRFAGGVALGRWVRAWARVAVWGGLIVLSVVALLVGYGALRHSRIIEADVEAAFREAARDAEYGAADLDRRLQEYDALHAMARLLSVEQMRNSGVAAAALAELRETIAFTRSAVEQVAAMDADGLLLWTTTTDTLGVINLADREHYRGIAKGGARVFVGRPVIGRVSRLETVQYSRGIYNTQGRLQAISVVSINAKRMVDSVDRRQPDRSRSGAVFRGDGVLLGVSGGRFPLASMPAELMREVEDAGVASAVLQGDDGQRYLTVLQRTAQVGLVLVLTREMAGVIEMAEARAVRSDIIMAAGGMVLILAIVLGTIALSVWERAQGARAAREGSEAAMAKVRQVTDNIHDVVLLWSIAGDGWRFHFVSPSSRTVLGVEPVELEANPLLVRFHPDDRPRALSNAKVLAEQGGVLRAEYRIVPPDGRIVWVQIVSTVLPVTGDGADQPRFISTLHDVTEQRAAAASLSVMTRRLEQITEAAPGVLYEINVAWREDGSYAIRLNFLSRSFPRVTGYPMALVARPGGFERFAGPESAALRHEAITRALKEDTASIEFNMTLGDGRTRRMRDTYNLEQRTSEGGVLVCFLSDITDEALLRDQLGEASKLSFLGEMAAGIAHELHQPLSAIMLHAETLAYEVPADVKNRQAIDERIERLVSLTERAADVIRRVRAFSRRDNEAPAPFDVIAAVSDGVAMMLARLNDALVEVRFAPEPGSGPESWSGPVPVVGHVAPFEQVIMNLLANACDEYAAQGAAGHRERTIEIAIARRGGRVLITVADHAGGIPMAVLPRIFEPFYTTKEQGKGTGLGLSICRRIIEDIGGTLSATNREDGAMFVIALPGAPADWARSVATTMPGQPELAAGR